MCPVYPSWPVTSLVCGTVYPEILAIIKFGDLHKIKL